jgi:hypothetical protein
VLLLPLLLMCTLLATSRPLRAAATKQIPCDPTSAAPSHCLVAEPFLTERLVLRAAGDGLLFATVSGPGEPHLRVLDVATLATHGVMPLDDTPLLYQTGRLYTAPASAATPSRIFQTVIGVAEASRPTLLGGTALPLEGALDWAIAPNALYVLGTPSEATGSDIHVYGLADAAHPQLAATLPNVQAIRIMARAGYLYTAAPTGLAIYDTSNPAAPTLLSNTLWFEDAPLDAIDLAVVQHILFFMGHARDTGESRCHAIDVRDPTGPVRVGDCPFAPHKTTFAAGYAYLNPNQSAAEYLDYQIYSLANPAAPALVGTTRQRWRTAFPVGGGLVTQWANGRVARLRQDGSGSLATAAVTWSSDALGMEGPVRAIIGDSVFIDQGSTGNDGGRVLRIADVAERSAPHLLGSLESTWIGARNLEATNGRLFALHRDRLTLFDLRNPAQPAQLGQFTSPLGDSLEHFILGGPNHAFLVSEHNTLLTVDLSTPTTPTLAGMVGLPGRTTAGAWANNALYLYGDEALIVADVSNPAAPSLARSIPLDAPPLAVSAWGSALYLVENAALQVVDVADPLNPIPRARVEPPPAMRFSPIPGAQSGRLALQVRRGAGAPPEAQPYVAIYDLSAGPSPIRVATVPGIHDDAYFDGARLLLPGSAVVAIGPRARYSAPLPAPPVDGVTVTPVGMLPPNIAFTYTLALAPQEARSAVIATETVHCLAHETDPAGPILAPTVESTYAGPFALRTVACDSGAPVAFSGVITLTVMLPPSTIAPWDWPQALLATDHSSAWAPIPSAVKEGSTWRAQIEPPIVWGVRGPAPPPVLLPWVAR